MTADAPAAVAFHAEAIGWSDRDSGLPGAACTLMPVGDAHAAGGMATPPEPGAMGPAEGRGARRAAHARDPQGAVFAQMSATR